MEEDNNNSLYILAKVAELKQQEQQKQKQQLEKQQLEKQQLEKQQQINIQLYLEKCINLWINKVNFKGNNILLRMNLIQVMNKRLINNKEELDRLLNYIIVNNNSLNIIKTMLMWEISFKDIKEYKDIRPIIIEKREKQWRLTDRINYYIRKIGQNIIINNNIKTIFLYLYNKCNINLFNHKIEQWGVITRFKLKDTSIINVSYILSLIKINSKFSINTNMEIINLFSFISAIATINNLPINIFAYQYTTLIYIIYMAFILLKKMKIESINTPTDLLKRLIENFKVIKKENKLIIINGEMSLMEYLIREEVIKKLQETQGRIIEKQMSSTQIIGITNLLIYYNKFPEKLTEWLIQEYNREKRESILKKKNIIIITKEKDITEENNRMIINKSIVMKLYYEIINRIRKLNIHNVSIEYIKVIQEILQTNENNYNTIELLVIITRWLKLLSKQESFIMYNNLKNLTIASLISATNIIPSVKEIITKTNIIVMILLANPNIDILTSKKEKEDIIQQLNLNYFLI